MVSSVFGPKPPIFGAAGADQASRNLPRLRGPTAKNQDQVLEERKSIFLEVLRLRGNGPDTPEAP